MSLGVALCFIVLAGIFGVIVGYVMADETWQRNLGIMKKHFLDDYSPIPYEIEPKLKEKQENHDKNTIEKEKNEDEHGTNE